MQLTRTHTRRSTLWSHKNTNTKLEIGIQVQLYVCYPSPCNDALRTHLQVRHFGTYAVAFQMRV